MSIALLELAAAALGDLVSEVVFTGGATVGLWITDPAAPEPRPTEDVDVIVEITSRGAFADFEERLRRRRFRHDRRSEVICRWHHADSDLVLDAMPTNTSILGFASRWQGAAVPHAILRELPSGVSISVVSPPYLIATKLEAFSGRGHDDHIASRDFADIVTLLDGRAELIQETASASADLRAYVAAELARHQAHWRFMEGIHAALPPDDASQARAEQIVVPRIQSIVSAS